MVALEDAHAASRALQIKTLRMVEELRKKGLGTAAFPAPRPK